MSKILHIPESFFTTLLTKSKMYSRVWFYWLSCGHADKFLDGDFAVQIIESTPKSHLYNNEELKKIFDFGVEILKAGDFKVIDQSLEALKPLVEEKKPKKNLVLIEQYKSDCTIVINALNKITGSTFSTKSATNNDLIAARLKEGFTVHELIQVIELKSKEWLNTSKSIYLRPTTLFQKSKFENYLNVNKNGTITNNPERRDSSSRPQGYANIFTALEEANRNIILR